MVPWGVFRDQEDGSQLFEYELVLVLQSAGSGICPVDINRRRGGLSVPWSRLSMLWDKGERARRIGVVQSDVALKRSDIECSLRRTCVLL
jgi:hypothetical protein